MLFAAGVSDGGCATEVPGAAKLLRGEATPDSSKVRIAHGAAQGSWLAELRAFHQVGIDKRVGNSLAQY